MTDGLRQRWGSSWRGWPYAAFITILFGLIAFAVVARWLQHPSRAGEAALAVFLVLYLTGWVCYVRLIILTKVELTADALIVRSAFHRHVIPLRDIEQCYHTRSAFYGRIAAVQLRDGRHIMCRAINQGGRLRLKAGPTDRAIATITAAVGEARRAHQQTS